MRTVIGNFILFFGLGAISIHMGFGPFTPEYWVIYLIAMLISINSHL